MLLAAAGAHEAIPLLLLFFIAVAICLLLDRRRARRAAARETQTELSADSATSADELDAVGGSGLVRRSSRTDAETIRLPTSSGSSWRRTVSTSGNSGMHPG